MKNDFICGVVEGFYGRPWTKIQREELFRKLKKWGMEAYVYAPKDDYKHRAYWRELYTVEEADHLSSLIAAAKEHNVRFFYALSPGLDMTYSSQKEIQTLKRKLDQVSQFGCDAFALLFDDIDSELSKVDKEVFQTFGNAQVSVTNEVYTHLGNPKFLFCPTQYCSSRATLSVRESEYLNTIGSKLNNDIDIMWTGNKVISKTITLESIQEITEVLRRPPVIWDNLHANDYDQKRVFLGPYTGRSPELIPHLRGVLTNPNCEFNANTIAIHTLAFWSQCSMDSKVNSSLSADIKLETENEDGISAEELPECCSSKNIYHPKVALKNAIAEWLPEFDLVKEAWGPITKPQPQVTMVMPIIPIIPSINTCMSLTTTTTTSTTTKTVTVPEVNTTQLQALADVCSTVSSSAMNPISNPVMNSLVSPTKVVLNDEIPNPIPSNAASNIELPKTIPISIVQVPIMENVKHFDTNSNEATAGTSELEMTPDNQEDSVVNVKEAMKCEQETQNTTTDFLDDGDIRIDEKTQTDVDPTPVLSIETDDNPPEAMEYSSLTSQTSPRETRKTEEDIVMTENSSIHEFNNSMQVESAEPSPLSNAEMKDIESSAAHSIAASNSDGADFPASVEIDKDKIKMEDLYLLCDLFYLPFEHGSRGCKLLMEFNWLKANAHVLLSKDGAAKKLNGEETVAPAKPEIAEWLVRAQHFFELCDSVQTLMVKLAKCSNKEICHDLFTYVWDIAGALTLMNAFVKWLSLGHFPHNMYTFTQGTFTWFSKGWKEAFMSGDQEPWVFRGGLIADLQRLMPVDSGNDLFLYKLPELPRSDGYLLRPYRYSDESAVYSVCKRAFMGINVSETDCEELPKEISDLIPDSIIGPYVTLQPEFCIVAHDSNNENEIVGYAAAAIDAQVFARNTIVSWLPDMREKYLQSSSALETLKSSSFTATLRGLVKDFDEQEYECPVEVSTTYPAALTTALLNDALVIDDGLMKRLIIVMLAALRSNGCFGVHVRLANAKHLAEEIMYYNRIGFTEVFRNNNFVYLGRRF